MSIRPVRHDHAIVDANRNLVTTRCQSAQFVHVGCNEASIGSDLLTIQPHGRFPVRTFESKHEATRRLVLKNIYVALIPAHSEKMDRRLRKKRHFYLAGISVLLVIIA